MTLTPETLTPELFEKWSVSAKGGPFWDDKSQAWKAGVRYIRARFKLRHDYIFGYWVEDIKQGDWCFYRFLKNGSPAFITKKTIKRYIRQNNKHYAALAEPEYSMDEIEIAMRVIEEMK